MGMILDTGKSLLGLERRRESYGVLDLERKYHSEHGLGPAKREITNIKSDHITVYGDGEIEMSKEFLLQLVEFFDDPEHRKTLEER